MNSKFNTCILMITVSPSNINPIELALYLNKLETPFRPSFMHDVFWVKLYGFNYLHKH